ncbi:MAG: hypothetical protein KJT03_01045, partial [Verrucomicrobiae bacterium]|nr:hypothetical protein [Verrucomicrobiae bacterium]
MPASSLTTIDLLAAPDPEPLPKGLDAINHAVHGKFAARKTNTSDLLKQAALADQLSNDFKRMSNEALRAELRSIKSGLRRAGGLLSEEEIPRGLAALRETGWRAWHLRAYPVQLAGLLGLHKGILIEMATGEGKTIVAAMAAVLAAWSGKPCHVVTVNDYLAQRDADQFSRIGEWTGLTVAAVTATLSPLQRREAYRANVVYTTSKEFLADFLRDRIALGTASDSDRLALRWLSGDDRGLGQVVQRGLHTAIIDEADSVLIDEAVTPLIISREQANESLRRACIEAFHLAEKLEPRRHYILDTRHKRVDLTSRGEKKLAELAEPLPA